MDRREFDDPDRVDVFTFRAVERLKVHEARTAAELESGVMRHATVVARYPVRRKPLAFRRTA